MKIGSLACRLTGAKLEIQVYNKNYQPPLMCVIITVASVFHSSINSIRSKFCYKYPIALLMYTIWKMCELVRVRINKYTRCYYNNKMISLDKQKLFEKLLLFWQIVLTISKTFFYNQGLNSFPSPLPSSPPPPVPESYYLLSSTIPLSYYFLVFSFYSRAYS